MAKSLVPAINAAGIYTLLPPFAAKLAPNVSYNCVGVRKIADIVAAGGAPQEDYYKAYGIVDDATYQADVDADVCIVTLQPPSGVVLYVPSTYITGFPDMGGVSYVSMVLGVALGSIPANLNLSFLESQMVSLVKDTIGITTTTVKEVIVSDPMLLSTVEHQSIEASRQLNITNTTTDSAKLVAMTAQRDALQVKVAQLEAYIVANPPANP